MGPIWTNYDDTWAESFLLKCLFLLSTCPDVCITDIYNKTMLIDFLSHYLSICHRILGLPLISLDGWHLHSQTTLNTAARVHISNGTYNLAQLSILHHQWTPTPQHCSTKLYPWLLPPQILTWHQNQTFWLLQTWFDRVPVYKLISQMWLLDGTEKFWGFTLHTLHALLICDNGRTIFSLIWNPSNLDPFRKSHCGCNTFVRFSKDVLQNIHLLTYSNNTLFQFWVQGFGCLVITCNWDFFHVSRGKKVFPGWFELMTIPIVHQSSASRFMCVSDDR